MGFIQSLGEESLEPTDTSPTQIETPQETEPEMPDEEPEPELPPATDEDLSLAVQEFMDERAEDGVMLA